MKTFNKEEGKHMLKKAGKKFLSVVLATAMVVSSITVYGASVKVPEDRVLTSVKAVSYTHLLHARK